MSDTQSKIQVKYDRDINLVGIGVKPWYRIGPEDWFKNYKIISYHDWDIDSDFVLSLSKHFPNMKLNRLNTLAMVSSPEFSKLVKENKLDDYKFLTYKPVSKDGYDFITKNSKVSQEFENKSWLRKQYSNVFPFAPHIIINKSEVEPYSKMIKELGEELVLQHESLSGGRGTFFASNLKDYNDALVQMEEASQNKDYDIVISNKLQQTIEVSIQCCVTRNHGTLIGPVQSQIVREPKLVNMEGGGDKFCGGHLLPNLLSRSQKNTVDAICSKTGKELSKRGYKGIFGIDFLLSGDEIYMVEVNARTTGMLPLINLTQDSIPFYLIHILELLEQNYTLPSNFNEIIDSQNNFDASFLVLHYLDSKSTVVNNFLASGAYDSDRALLGSSLARLKSLNDSMTYWSYINRGDSLKQGDRIGAIFSANDLSLHGKNNQEATGLISHSSELLHK